VPGWVEKRLISLCGKAIHGWAMIGDGDRVAVGLSGGKDSLSLLWLLVERLRRVPIDYHLVALHVEMGFGRVDTQALHDYCRELGVGLVVRTTDFGPRAHTAENRESPCFFCAMHRRRELFQMTVEQGCNKLALAHHQDDIHETFLLNVIYSGNLSTMMPVQPFFDGKITVVRPLALAAADLTRRFAQAKELPVQPPCCPSAGDTRRARVGQVLDSFYRENKKVRGNIWHAITHPNLEYLPSPPNLKRK
jgi:tRNA 2-thiocytidine biosynthesis protein TtcA